MGSLGSQLHSLCLSSLGFIFWVHNYLQAKRKSQLVALPRWPYLKFPRVALFWKVILRKSSNHQKMAWSQLPLWSHLPLIFAKEDLPPTSQTRMNVPLGFECHSLQLKWPSWRPWLIKTSALALSLPHFLPSATTSQSKSPVCSEPQSYPQTTTKRLLCSSHQSDWGTVSAWKSLKCLHADLSWFNLSCPQFVWVVNLLAENNKICDYFVPPTTSKPKVLRSAKWLLYLETVFLNSGRHLYTWDFNVSVIFIADLSPRVI